MRNLPTSKKLSYGAKINGTLRCRSWRDSRHEIYFPRDVSRYAVEPMCFIVIKAASVGGYSNAAAVVFPS